MFVGVGAACVNAACVVLMPRAFFGGKMTDAAVNLGMVFVALGSLVTPTLAVIWSEDDVKVRA